MKKLTAIISSAVLLFPSSVQSKTLAKEKLYTPGIVSGECNYEGYILDVSCLEGRGCWIREVTDAYGRCAPGLPMDYCSPLVEVDYDDETILSCFEPPTGCSRYYSFSNC